VSAAVPSGPVVGVCVCVARATQSNKSCAAKHLWKQMDCAFAQRAIQNAALA